MNLNKKLFLCFISLMMLFVLGACNKKNDEVVTIDTEKITLDEIKEKAKEEGEVNSVGMPDNWANWVQTWSDLKEQYGLAHVDTDMSSIEEINKFDAEKDNATVEIGDVGIAFGPVAVERGVTLPYKTSYWEEVPEWAKDKDGHWIVGYTGTLAFMVNKKNTKDIPQTWEDLLSGDYVISMGDVAKDNQAQFSVLAAAYSRGGDEKNLQPGLEFYAELAKQGRLSTNANFTSLEKGELDVIILWDFNALNFRDMINKEQYEVVIPQDGTVRSGYATILNKYSKRPHAAMLAREYILSDEGQINLARGYARPIRENVELPEDAKSKLLPSELYKDVYIVEDAAAWEETTKNIPQMWQEEVLIHVN